MSSFFTKPASSKRQKRADGNLAERKPRKAIEARGNGPRPAKKVRRDESISSTDSEGRDGRKRQNGDDDDLSQLSSQDGDETAAERRLRLAEQYLENVKGEVHETVGFDAEDVDRDLIAERLQEDVAENKGQLYQRFSSLLQCEMAVGSRFRMKTATTTGISVCAPYAYIVSKDGHLSKWELPSQHDDDRHNRTTGLKDNNLNKGGKVRPIRQRPERICQIRAPRSKSDTLPPQASRSRPSPLLCVAASSDGRFVVTGGMDKQLVVYNAKNLEVLKIFAQHRDAITALSFRQGTNQLFSASRDRTIKVWSLDELAYVETLFGHQDEVIDVAAFPWAERCVSVGSRDRTARIWKVVEETQLIFRGGGFEHKKAHRSMKTAANIDEPVIKAFAEQTIDSVAIIDNETFVTGSANGSLSLWSMNKKKAVYTIPLAHGLDAAMSPHEASAETHIAADFALPEEQPRGITALATIPLSDIVVSGSWDDYLRLWKVTESKKQLELVGVLSRPETSSKLELSKGPINGFVNGLKIFAESGNKQNTVQVLAAIGSEPRLGRWRKLPARSGAISWRIPCSPENHQILKSSVT